MIAALVVDAEIVLLGLFTGLTYAVMAAGLVLVYRATRVINFAHGEMGALSASVLAVLVVRHDWNFFLALGVAVALGGGIGAAVELAIIRRLFNAPRLILLVATIGVSQVLFVLQLLLPGFQAQARYPSPIDRQLEIGDVILRSEHFMVLAFVPTIIIGLWYLLTRTPHGIDIRASAENADRAELAGISTRRVSTMVWIVAGALAALTVVLINPLRGTILGLPSEALGPMLLLRALTAALIGRMTSLPMTLVGGVLVGVVEATLLVNVANPGVVDLLLLLVVLGLVLSRRYASAEAGTAGWSLAPRVRGVPDRLLGRWWIRRLNWLVAGFGLTAAATLPLIARTSSQTFLFSHVLVYSIIGLSITVLIGWAGQLSLGQFAVTGLGAMVTAALNQYGMPLGFAIAYATLSGILVAMLIGYPALRVPGLFLAVTTLALAVAGRNWIFTHEIFLGRGNRTARVERGELLGVDLGSERAFYYVCLIVLAVCIFLVSRLRASGVGRSIIAVRDNTTAAAAFTVPPTAAKLTAFAISGGLAAMAGGLLAGLRVELGPSVFGPEESLRIVGMAVIGGLGSIGGAVLGAVYVIGLPALFGHSRSVGLLTSGAGLLVLLLFLPGGLVQLVYRARDLLLAAVDQRPTARRALRAAPSTLPARPADTPRATRDAAATALLVDGVTVRFGGRLALDDLSIEARPGEIVGLIGSNGAGKSTLLNVIGGSLTSDTGRIEVFGSEISAVAAHKRAALGVGRVFQDARLFPDLTVKETVLVALEAAERTELIPSLLGVAPSRRSERRKANQADECMAFLGLGEYAHSFVSELSTGTRRVVELCCLLAQRADLLLLDEPTAGLAQRETEAFGPMIRRIQHELGATIVMVEHDMPLVMELSDRLYCLTAGVVIAEGPPEVVRNDPTVIASYLGTDERSILRSGMTNGHQPPTALRQGRDSRNGTVEEATGRSIPSGTVMRSSGPSIAREEDGR